MSEYIEESDETPIFRKSAQFRSLSERIVDDFLFYREKHPDLERAKVKKEKLQGKSARAMCRGIGKVFLKKAKEGKKNADEWTARVDESGQVWILRR